MENKEAFKIQNKIGTDEKDMNKNLINNEEERTEEKDKTDQNSTENKAESKETDKEKEELIKLKKEREPQRYESWKKALERLPEDLQEKINDTQLHSLAKGEKIEGEGIEQLTIERQKLLQEEEDKIKADMMNEFDMSAHSVSAFFGQLKRGLVVGAIAGMPGVAIMLIYDFCKCNQTKNQFSNAINSMLDKGDFSKMDKTMENVNKKYGKMINIGKLLNQINEHIMGSDYLENITDNKQEMDFLKQNLQFVKENYTSEEDSKKLDKCNELLEITRKDNENSQAKENKIEDKEFIGEIEMSIKEDEEDNEEDPEPIEGMSISY